jgi:hypothetical protein
MRKHAAVSRRNPFPPQVEPTFIFLQGDSDNTPGSLWTIGTSGHGGWSCDGDPATVR